MAEIKGLWFGINKSFGLGFTINFDSTMPNVFFIEVGPFYMEINRWRYWKNYFK